MSAPQHPIGKVNLKSQAWLSDHVKGLYVAVLLLIIITCTGIVGYSTIEGWSQLDSFYMTIITLSTVGYGEVQSLSPEGKIFSSILIMGGMTVAAYCFGVIGRSALQGELYRYRRLLKMNKQIANMKGHTIICGFGRLAGFVIPEIVETGKQIVVIESNPDKITQINLLGLPYIEGSAHDDEVLLAAGVDKASALLALTSNDSENVFITLCARALNSRIVIMARAEDPALD